MDRLSARFHPRAAGGRAAFSSAGLATGNSDMEALAGAVVELIEHDLDAAFDRLNPIEMRTRELDLDSVDAPAARALLRRLRTRGAGVRVWSQGQDAGMPALRCAITDGTLKGHALPAGGNGRHPDREVALIRAVPGGGAIAQHRGRGRAGEDLGPADYLDGRERTERLISGSLSLGAGAAACGRMRRIDRPRPVRRGRWTRLLACAGALVEPCRSSLSSTGGLILISPWCTVLAPGLGDSGRASQPSRSASPRQAAAVPRKERAAVGPFVGPTPPAVDVSAGLEVRPPAVCGDLAALLRDPPPAGRADRRLLRDRADRLAQGDTGPRSRWA